MIERQIIKGIKAYAKAYGRFQELQDKNPGFLAVGDQKTGVIGEFFGLLYARSHHKHAKVEYAAPNQTGWDIEVSGNESGPDLKIQVKTVSAFSKTRVITPLFPGWDHLYLMFVGRDFMPQGFWNVVDSNSIFQGRDSLTGLKMRKPDNAQSGSSAIPWGENHVDSLLKVIDGNDC